jgi:hypothetical protein
LPFSFRPPVPLFDSIDLVVGIASVGLLEPAAGVILARHAVNWRRVQKRITQNDRRILSAERAGLRAELDGTIAMEPPELVVDIPLIRAEPFARLVVAYTVSQTFLELEARPARPRHIFFGNHFLPLRFDCLFKHLSIAPFAEMPRRVRVAASDGVLKHDSPGRRSDALLAHIAKHFHLDDHFAPPSFT